MAAKQRKFHLVTEALGVLLGMYLFVLGIYLDTHFLIRLSLIITGIAGMIIDSYCIITWYR